MDNKTYDAVQVMVSFERSDVASFEKPKLVCRINVNANQLAGADVDEECYSCD